MAINILRTPSLGPVGTVVPEVNVFNLPFIFRSQEHARAVIDGPIGDELLAKVSASPAKLVAIGWMDGGARSLYTKKPVRTPADLKGQKVRMMGNPLFVDTMNAMGGNGISMGYGEVFTALQTGVVDGAENNAPSYFTSNHYNTGAKYYTPTNHLIIPELLVVSKATWDKTLQGRSGPAQEVRPRSPDGAAGPVGQSVAENTAKLKSAGVEFITVDNKPFYEATAPVRAKSRRQLCRSLNQRIEAVK